MCWFVSVSFVMVLKDMMFCLFSCRKGLGQAAVTWLWPGAPQATLVSCCPLAWPIPGIDKTFCFVALCYNKHSHNVTVDFPWCEILGMGWVCRQWGPLSYTGFSLPTCPVHFQNYLNIVFCSIMIKQTKFVRWSGPITFGLLMCSGHIGVIAQHSPHLPPACPMLIALLWLSSYLFI